MPGVYISYPFCAQKCTYCNFASGVLPRETEASYVDAVAKEIACFTWNWTPETVFLGGGTPSALTPESLRKILSRVPGRPWQEATMEAAPGSFDVDALRTWVELGINRVSLGVQSFVRAELSRTGRRHTAETVFADIANLRAVGLGNFNVDLIAGLPGQTAASWSESLDCVERLNPPHVSVYMLEVDQESRLGRELLLGGVRYGAGDVPDDDAIASFYETAVERLEQAGIRRYEISNFSRPGFESIHNLKYWKREPYAGFGSDAHSFDGKNRWHHPESVEDYLASGPHARLNDGLADAAEEKFFVGLRLLEGVDATPAELQRHESAIDRLLNGGLLEQSGLRLRLTPKGVMLSNEVFEQFLNP